MADGCGELFPVHSVDNRVFCSLVEVGLNVCLAHIIGNALLDECLADLCRRNAMLCVVCHLLGSSSVGFVDGLLHTLGYLVGIENGSSIHVAGCTTNGLGERAMAAEKSFLVCIEYGNE